MQVCFNLISAKECTVKTYIVLRALHKEKLMKESIIVSRYMISIDITERNIINVIILLKLRADYVTMT